MGIKVMTPQFRASFASVFQPKRVANDDKAEPQYSVVMLFAKGADIASLKNAAQRALEDKFGPEKVKKLVASKKLKTPFKDQATLVDKNGDMHAGCEAGAIYIQANRKQKDGPPGIVDEKVQDIIDQDEFYSGCYARATVEAYAWEHRTGGTGVSFALHNIQRLKHGDRLGGGGKAKPSDEFEAMATADGDAPANADDLWNDALPKDAPARGRRSGNAQQEMDDDIPF